MRYLSESACSFFIFASLTFAPFASFAGSPANVDKKVLPSSLPVGGPKQPHGTLKIEFELSPAGSFLATTAAVYGFGILKGGKVMAGSSPVVIHTSTFKTGITLRDEHMRRRLETVKFPQAIFQKIEAINESEGRGELTVRGITKTVEFHYKVIGSNDKVEATFPIKISDFKIEEVSYMGVGVEDEAKGTIELPLYKK